MSHHSPLSTSTRAPDSFDKQEVKAKQAALLEKIADLQNLFYASSKHSLLIVLQGMDASGKDGLVRKVFGSMNPLGCKVFAFKKPSEIELKHDFLWRVHQQTPPLGMVHVFNRSHYEDVLIQKVHKWVGHKTIKQRYEQINNFENLLVENNTLILKFYLHLSKEEQLERLTERTQNPQKMWKYEKADIIERNYWDDYMKAYELAFKHCNEIPWHIIPADQNWYKEMLVAEVLIKTLEKLNLQYPGMT